MVAIYDPLVWYHPEISAIAKRSLYLAQDFFGVTERLSRDRHLFGDVHIVPPIVPAVAPTRRPEIALVNLGGLQNPMWPVECAVLYARAVIETCRTVIAPDLPIEIAVSQAIACRLSMHNVRCYSPQDMAVLAAACWAGLNANVPPQKL